MTQHYPLPILYSFRRCPYAIRARLAITVCNIDIELREVLLANKPKAMLKASPKGTVPVLVLTNGNVIDESLDIMLWALQENQHSWLDADTKKTTELIQYNDNIFKTQLDHYKYADRFPERSIQHDREAACIFLHNLETLLCQHKYLVGHHFSLADAAIFPFIRQFAFVDKHWFEQTPYKKLQLWLDNILNSDLFSQVMKKHSPWVDTL